MKTFKSIIHQKLLLSFACAGVIALFSTHAASVDTPAIVESELKAGAESESAVLPPTEKSTPEQTLIATSTAAELKQQAADKAKIAAALAKQATAFTKQAARESAQGARAALAKAAEITEMRKQLETAETNPELTELMATKLLMLMGDESKSAQETAKDLRTIHDLLEFLGIIDSADFGTQDIMRDMQSAETPTLSKAISILENAQRSINRKARTFPKTSVSLSQAATALQSFIDTLEKARKDIFLNPDKAFGYIELVETELQRLITNGNIGDVIHNRITYYFPDKKNAKKILVALIGWLKDPTKVQQALSDFAATQKARKAKTQPHLMPPTPQEQEMGYKTIMPIGEQVDD